jgi:hypothetical protein
MLAAGAVLNLVPHGFGVLCPLRLTTGVPCPMCGMTTSVKATLRGDLAGSLAANPGGLLLVLAVLCLFVARPERLFVPVWLIPLVVVPLWLFELTRFGFL